jgi:hypothetical protein
VASNYVENGKSIRACIVRGVEVSELNMEYVRRSCKSAQLCNLVYYCIQRDQGKSSPKYETLYFIC